MKFDGTDTYPVGVLLLLQGVWRVSTSRDSDLRGKRLHIIRTKVRWEVRYIAGQAKARNWRAVRNAFNGYLAEHGGHPHNCGRGWTKRAAERRAERLCRTAQTSPETAPGAPNSTARVSSGVEGG